MMRHTRLATTTDVYMQSLESGVRSTINSIHDELKGIVTPGTEPLPTAETQINRKEPRNALAVQNSRAFLQERIRATRGEVAASVPTRGVVLEFATRMRQSERRKIV